MKNLIYLAILVLSVSISSCSKEGPIGPAGPQGPQGPTGTTGPAGQDASVPVSTTLYVNNWVYSASAPSYMASISVPAITQNVLDRGIVAAYVSNGSGGWIALPMTWYPTTTYSYTYSCVHALGYLHVHRTDSDGIAVNPGGQTFKIVVIPPAFRMANPNLNWENYAEIEGFLQQE